MTRMIQNPAEPALIPLDEANGAGEKHSSLFGGAAEEALLPSSPAVLRRTRGGSSLVGLQQWFTPEPAARLVAEVFGPVEGVLDPTAGSGALLRAFDERARYGIEIDRDHIPKGASKGVAPGRGSFAEAITDELAAGERFSEGSEEPPELFSGVHYRAAHGDAQRVVPMLRAAGLRWPAVAANPPFGLNWRDAAHAGEANGNPKAKINSTVLAFLWALDLLAPFGQGAIILGRDRLAREILSRPEAAGIYAVADVEGELFDGVGLPCSIAFFVRRRTAPVVIRSASPPPARIYLDWPTSSAPRGATPRTGSPSSATSAARAKPLIRSPRPSPTWPERPPAGPPPARANVPAGAGDSTQPGRERRSGR